MQCRFVRHPGYLGWFIWAVGTQVLLCNPLSMISFAYVVRLKGHWYGRVCMHAWQHTEIAQKGRAHMW